MTLSTFSSFLPKRGENCINPTLTVPPFCFFDLLRAYFSVRKQKIKERQEISWEFVIVVAQFIGLFVSLMNQATTLRSFFEPSQTDLDNRFS
jgi:hypothetical protein